MKGLDGTDPRPLHNKAYGHIPHLPGSRIGPADHHCHEGQVRICTERTRDRHDLIIVQEKLDGSCVSVARIGSEIVPLTRSGYRAETSPYEQHHLFGDWARENSARFLQVLEDGERLCGEWLAQAHGTRYSLVHEPFVAFDLMYGWRRATFDELQVRVRRGHLVTPFVLHSGGPFSIKDMLAQLEPSKHGARPR